MIWRTIYTKPITPIIVKANFLPTIRAYIKIRPANIIDSFS